MSGSLWIRSSLAVQLHMRNHLLYLASSSSYFVKALGGSGWYGGRKTLTVPALSYSRQTPIIMMRLCCGMLAMAPCSCSCAMCMHLAHMMLSVGNLSIETPASVAAPERGGPLP